MRRRLLLLPAAALAAVLLLSTAGPSGAAATAAPSGVTGIGLDSSVQLAWQPVAGATGYTVYRGTSPSSVTTALTSVGGVAGTTYTDTTATNGSTYYYAVRSVASGVESASSLVVQSGAVHRACSTGNAIVLENCYPGNTGWTPKDPTAAADGGIEGYATSQSIDQGGSIDLKVNTSASTTFNIEIYRSGYYGGAGARLFSVIRNVPGTAQPACASDPDTGLYDCANWSTSATITTTSNWPSGIYLIRLVRNDNGTDNQIIFVVRDDSSHSDILYGTSMSTFEAYNGYGGKSLYDFNSYGDTTVAGTARAVKVSFDRPFDQPVTGERDWYPNDEFATVYWLEEMGYDVSYISNTDMETNGSLLLNHKTYISPAHDEYISAAMRSAMTNARDAGVNLFFTGSNEDYWKIRFENSPTTGAAMRTEVCYKSVQSGGPDPSGISTSAWRDPNGPNQPENALSGEMYIGDNDDDYFPLVVTAAEGTDRIYRYTDLSTQTPGTSASIGNNLVGWEWDAVVNNGQEPAGVKVLSSSPVNGELVQGNGATYVQNQPATVSMVKYTAPSGALVLTTGTNHWNRGLALNAFGVGEPNSDIQQITTNILEDMGAVPQTPSAGITLDNPQNRPAAPANVTAAPLGSDSVTVSWSSVPNATGYDVYRALAPRQGGQPLGTLANGEPLTGTSFTDTGLASATDYYYVVTAIVGGVQSLASNEVSATTAAAPGAATRIDAGGDDYTSSTGVTYRADTFFTGGSTNSTTATITGTSDPTLYQTERYGQFEYDIPVANGIYDVRFHFAELYYKAPCTGKRVFGMDILNTPVSPDLSNIDICKAVGPDAAYDLTVSRVSVTNGVLSIRSVYGSADDPEVTAIEVIPDQIAPSVTATTPANGSGDVPVASTVTATFSEAMSASTLTSSTFTLTGPGGTTVPASVTYDSATATATLTPSSSLAYGTTYTAEITTGAQASDGTPLSSPVSWSFTTHQQQPPLVSSTFPSGAATGVSPSVRLQAVFNQPLDASTINGSSFTLSGPSGSVSATVSYDQGTSTATLVPDQALATGASYTATLSTAIVGLTDDLPLASPVTWTFTTAATAPAPPTVAISPGAGATNVAVSATVQATFSRAMYAPSISDTTFAVTGPSGAVAGSVSYNPSSLTATFTPSAPLVAGTAYTATLDASIAAADGTPLGSSTVWSFTTIAPPTVTAVTPAAGAAYVSRSGPVTVTFSRAMDPASLTNSSVTVTPASGTAVSASVSYDSASDTATLTPTDLLAGGATYTATVDTDATAADGTPLAQPYSWTFTTAACPCSLFPDDLTPALTGLSTEDGRSGTGPFTYELGTRFTVDEPMQLTSFRFYKSPGETGTHIGKLWSADGTLLAEQQFATETDSGWQEQALSTPYTLEPGTVYTISVNANAYFVSTQTGLATQVASGPVRTVADGENGTYASAAGTFPSQSYDSSNYFVDGVFVPDGQPAPLGVVSTSPAGGADDVPRSAVVSVQFSRPVDPSTLTQSNFDVIGDEDSVPGTISYDDATQTATFAPTNGFGFDSTYTVKLTTGIHATDGMPLGSTLQWSFDTAEPVPPQVTWTLPAAGATDATPGTPVEAEFSKDMDPSTLTSSTFTLTGPSGAVAGTVSYESSTMTAELKPSAPLTAGATYTAKLAGVVGATDGSTLDDPDSWTFTVSSTTLPPPTVTSASPSNGATEALRNVTITAVVSRPLDPATVTPATVTLTDSSGATVAAAVSYDQSSQAITLTPDAELNGAATYTVTLTTGVQTIDGTPFAAPYTWSFTTAECPCSLFSAGDTPTLTGLSTVDGRTGSGPFTYELGVKVTVDQPTEVTAIRFYKSPGETGTHIGRIWTSDGTQVAQTTFTNETASGWQTQPLTTPYTMQPGAVYTVSVNANAYFVATSAGLASSIVSGPLQTVADGNNGVFGVAAGLFPDQSYLSNDYYVDVTAAPVSESPPTVASTSPSDGATGVATTDAVAATFSRSMDASSLTTSSFTLAGPSGPVTASVSYDSATDTVSLQPSTPLAFDSVYTARIAAAALSDDGSAMGAAYSWSFTTENEVAPQVTSTVPASGAGTVNAGVVVRADFSKPLDPGSVDSSTFTLSGPSGAVAATVGYDSSGNEASLTPTSSLAPGAYTATLAGSITAADGSTLGSPYSWTFTVPSTPVPLTITSGTPADGTTGVPRDSTVTAAFSRDVTPSSITTASFELLANGVPAAASVSYDATSRTATLTPSSQLSAQTAYTVQLTNAIHTDDGTSLSGTTSWSFTTSTCPCSAFDPSVTPALTGLPTEDGRSGSGPFSYEFGMAFTVDSPVQLTAIRFYKDAQETGAHTGTLWTSDGTQLATVSFANETSSGWQQQDLSAPVQLEPGVTYIVSVNANAFFVDTPGGLATSQGSGPLHSVVGSNGLFGEAAGVFPSETYNSSNYFVDVVVQ